MVGHNCNGRGRFGGKFESGSCVGRGRRRGRRRRGRDGRESIGELGGEVIGDDDNVGVNDRMTDGYICLSFLFFCLRELI
jgi:hypothetical protein